MSFTFLFTVLFACVCVACLGCVSGSHSRFQSHYSPFVFLSVCLYVCVGGEGRKSEHAFIDAKEDYFLSCKFNVCDGAERKDGGQEGVKTR